MAPDARVELYGTILGEIRAQIQGSGQQQVAAVEEGEEHASAAAVGLAPSAMLLDKLHEHLAAVTRALPEEALHELIAGPRSAPDSAGPVARLARQ